MLKELLLDILLPRKCLGCNKEGEYICQKCQLHLSEVPPRPDNIISLWEYEGLIKKAISKIKNNGQHDIVSELVEKAFEKMDLNLPANTYITFVPLSRTRERQRGFNQAALIAKKVGEKTGRPVTDLLEKTDNGERSNDLNAAERAENIKNAFRVKETFICPENVLVVDDFSISGATMKECFRVLKEAGAENVWGFTLARLL